MENVRFYAKNDRSTAREIGKEQVSAMLLDVFEDVLLRVFCKEPELVDKLSELLSSWCISQSFAKPITATSFDQWSS